MRDAAKVEIEEVRALRARVAFARLPRSIRGDDPHFVPPLVPEVLRALHPRRNPFFRHGEAALFLARRAGSFVGRASASRDRLYEEFSGESVGVFGHFESADDGETARALLGAAAQWLRARGLRRIRGPVNLSTNYECGLLVEGFDSAPAVGMNHNPPYYASLLEGWGLRKAKDLLAYAMWTERTDAERVVRLAERLSRRGAFRVRAIETRRFARDVASIHEVYRAAWERNWGFAPMSDAEFGFLARGMRRVLDPDLCFLAEEGDRAIGFVLALPDVNRAVRAIDGRLFPFGIFRFPALLKKVRALRVLTLGVVPDRRGTGVDAALIGALVRSGIGKGIEFGEMSWVLEDNVAMRRPIEALGGVVYKRYRIYEAPIEGTGGG